MTSFSDLHQPPSTLHRRSPLPKTTSVSSFLLSFPTTLPRPFLRIADYLPCRSSPQSRRKLPLYSLLHHEYRSTRCRGLALPSSLSCSFALAPTPPTTAVLAALASEWLAQRLERCGGCSTSEVELGRFDKDEEERAATRLRRKWRENRYRRAWLLCGDKRRSGRSAADPSAVERVPPLPDFLPPARPPLDSPAFGSLAL